MRRRLPICLEIKALSLLSLSLSSSLLASTDKRLLASTIGLCIGSMSDYSVSLTAPSGRGTTAHAVLIFAQIFVRFRNFICIFVSDF
jgi:hypothetical protein